MRKHPLFFVRRSCMTSEGLRLTLPVARRSAGWLNETSHARVREIMLHAAAREGLACPTYCLMPDHIHLVWMGLRLESDQKNAMKFLREHLGLVLRPHSFQHQAHDHVMREQQRKRNAFWENLLLRDGQRVPGRAGEASQRMAVLRSGRAGLSHVSSLGRGLLAVILEAANRDARA